mgnify:CR=1 FL=1
MKANRKYKENEEAVSAVIGVILMVAITVAIAATVYVYVSGMIGGGGQQTPTIAFTVDSGNDKMIVASADAATNWDDINITTSPSHTWNLTHNGGSTTHGTDNETTDADVTAGDYILISGDDGNVQVTVRYDPTNSLIGTWTVNV